MAPVLGLRGGFPRNVETGPRRWTIDAFVPSFGAWIHVGIGYLSQQILSASADTDGKLYVFIKANDVVILNKLFLYNLIGKSGSSAAHYVR